MLWRRVLYTAVHFYSVGYFLTSVGSLYGLGMIPLTNQEVAV